MRAYISALRIRQWLKNLLIFVPLFAAHRITEVDLLVQAALAFVSFGFCASAVYVVNDLIDLQADRRHPVKRERPFASGTIPPSAGWLLAPLCLAASMAVATFLPGRFLIVLVSYFGLTTLYSLGLKKVALVDVLTLAALYTMRIVAGGAATGVDLSFWLLACSVFLFWSLAIIKRYSELGVMEQIGESGTHGRDYRLGDADTLNSLGAASGYIAVLVLALYIHSPDVENLYGTPQLLWLVCPVALFWISRMWLLAGRGEMPDDPVQFAVTDPISYAAVGICAAILYFAA